VKGPQVPCKCGYAQCERAQIPGSVTACITCGQPYGDHCITEHVRRQVENLERRARGDRADAMTVAEIHGSLTETELDDVREVVAARARRHPNPIEPTDRELFSSGVKPDPAFDGWYCANHVDGALRANELKRDTCWACGAARKAN
jgi:hypothetical protein